MDRSLKQEQRLAWLLLGAAMAAAVAFLFWQQRDLAFDGDSFNWMLLIQPGELENLLRPYGGHLILTPFLVFKAVLGVAGGSYAAMGVVQVAMLLVLSALIYEYGRRRLGPLLALPAAILVLFLGSSSSVLLQPMIGIQFLCCLVPGVAGLLALERGDLRGDLAACLLFSLSVLGFEMGLAFAAGAAVGIALREDRWRNLRRAWVVAIPFLIYGAWRLWAAKYGGSGIQAGNVFWIPAYAADSLGVIGASIFGLFVWPGSGQLTYLKLVGFDLPHVGAGLFVLAIEIVAIGLAARWLRKRGPLRPAFWVALTVLVSLWIEQGVALGPSRTPGEVRYVLADTVAFLLVALECLRGIRVTPRALIVAAVLTALAIFGNLFRFQEGRDILVEYSTGAKATFAAIRLDGAWMEYDFNPATEAPSAFIPGRESFIGPSLAKTLDTNYGPFGYTLAELREQPEATRRTADIVAATGMMLGTRLVMFPAADGVRCETPVGRSTVRMPPGGAVLVAEQTTPLRLRRFASNYPVELGELQAGVPTVVGIPTDASKQAWHAYAPGARGLASCPLPPPPG